MIIKILRNESRGIKVNFLTRAKIKHVPLVQVWRARQNNLFSNGKARQKINIFGTLFDVHQTFSWHKDYISEFEYPMLRFDKINIAEWFDKGIDIKFPWEMSRLSLLLIISVNYLKTKELKYYRLYKRQLIDWINKNPFCYGINWNCTMNVAIRAINLTVSFCYMKDLFEQENDKTVLYVLSDLLIQHAEYISRFPEVKKSGHTNNHTVANYAGLLFLALVLANHKKSGKWLTQAIRGLESCIRYQTYDDGVNFEGSIPYHGYVLEMLAYSAIVSRANDIFLSNTYYKLLFRMFEYTAAYVDHNGNAPAIGDNDSGKILDFHIVKDQDHSCLIDLAEIIFNYKIPSQCSKKNPFLYELVPAIKKMDLEEIGVSPRKTDRSIIFDKGGAYCLKNKHFSLLVSCFPLGQCGKGGHNHLDAGSFTLSVDGVPIIVDPGTFSYTRDYQFRNKFRCFTSHNALYPSKEINGICESKEEGLWRLQNIFETKLLEFSNRHIKIEVVNKHNGFVFTRSFEFENDFSLIIADESDDKYKSVLHFSPLIALSVDMDNVIINNDFLCLSPSSSSFTTMDYEYSPCYNKKQSARVMICNNFKHSKLKFELQSK